MEESKTMKIEDKWQKLWYDNKVFESEIDFSKEKFFGTEAYPYANSIFHIGHGRTYTIADVFMRFQILLGKNILHPLGFHISGTPVLAVSENIKRKDEKAISQIRDAISDYITDKKKQDETIKSFEDPQKIADFFSSTIEGALKSIGTTNDFSRKFTTGEPIYNKFIEWQYSKLKKEGLLKQGTYPILYSSQAENAVGEDDIKEGDTDKVSISNMSLIKFKINNFDKVDFFDENENFVKTDYFPNEKNLFHKSSTIFCLDKNNRVILQKGSSKIFSANKLKSSAGGIVKTGDDFDITACKEMEEELKIKLSLEDLKNSISVRVKEKYDFRKLYFLKLDCDLKKYDIKNSEVDKLVKISLDEFKDHFNSNKEKYSNSTINNFELIIENLQKIKETKPIKCEFTKEDKSDNLNEEFICCATLRPDSLFGATNLYVKPSMDLLKLKVNEEVWYVSKESKIKIENQFSKVEVLEELKGEQLLNKTVFVPIIEKVVPIYKADFCDEDHGTGIVYSSPADSPHDYIHLFETLHPSKSLNEFLDCEPLNLKPITKTFDKKGNEINYKFDIPAYSKLIENKIFNSKENEGKLEKVKQELYKEAHFGAIMVNCTKEFDGTKLKGNVAFDKTKNKLKELNLGCEFYETSRRAITRAGDKVIVANLQGQWFLDYSDKEVKKKAFELMDYLNYLPKNLIQTQKDYINWANLRPCTRKRGLGTKLPYDKNWIIEPLSDSTIYQMLYILIKKIRKHNLPVEKLSFDFFDYTFLEREKSKPKDIDDKILKELKEEFEYWKNVDFRYTAWAHMSNHLNFLIYHYSIIFEKKNWPKQICVGQFMMRNSEKISKSKGNGTPLFRIKKKFGADLFRLYIGITSNYDVEMNFKDDDVFLLKKKFDKFKDYCLNSSQKNKKQDLEIIDKWLISKFYMRCEKYFSCMNDFKIREAFVEIFYEVLNDLNYHSKRTNLENTFSVLRIFLEDFLILMTPIIPHICEEVYEKIKSDKNEYISLKKFDTDYKSLVEKKIIQKEDIITKIIQKILQEKEVKKINKIKKIEIYQAKEKMFDLFFEIKEELEKNKNDIKSIFENLNKNFSSYNKFIKKFVPKCFKQGISFFMKKEEEKNFLKENLLSYLKKEFDCEVEILESENSKSIPSDLDIKIN